MNDIYLGWLDEQVGCWRSTRTYYYISQDASSIKRKDEVSTIIDITKEGDTNFLVKWVSNKTKGPVNISVSDGEMLLTYDRSNHTLLRSRGYFTELPTKTLMVPNDNGMTLYTEYDGFNYIERMYNITHKVRTRQTVQTRNGEVALIGQYVEIRQLDHESTSRAIKATA